MKREIKFRGLRVDGKGWVYGYYVGGETKHFICASPFDIQYEVLPDTVGQLTGMEAHLVMKLKNVFVEYDFRCYDKSVALFRENYLIGVSIFYLHQLQNFYYCLTGKELEIKL